MSAYSALAALSERALLRDLAALATTRAARLALDAEDAALDARTASERRAVAAGDFASALAQERFAAASARRRSAIARELKRLAAEESNAAAAAQKAFGRKRAIEILQAGEARARAAADARREERSLSGLARRRGGAAA